MEIVRALDLNHDFLFGQGLNDYKSGRLAVAQDIQCNLLMFLGDCFFATNQGVDWFNLLGGKNELAVNLSVNAAILNTLGVTGLLQTSARLDERTRDLTLMYRVQTVYGILQDQLVYSFGLAG